MSRIVEYDGDMDYLAEGRWLAREKMALRSKRGRADLLKLKSALEALQKHELIEGRLCDGKGVCALGAMSYRSMVDGGMTPRGAWDTLRKVFVDFDSRAETAREAVDFAMRQLGITETLAYSVMIQNDSGWGRQTPAERYLRVMRWIELRLADPPLSNNCRSGCKQASTMAQA